MHYRQSKTGSHRRVHRIAALAHDFRANPGRFLVDAYHHCFFGINRSQSLAMGRV